MGTLSKVIEQLKKERDAAQRQLSGINAAIAAFAGVYTGAKPKRKGRTLSAEARKKIAAAQRKRWTAIKNAKKKKQAKKKKKA